jgi:hypothetical protein
VQSCTTNGLRAKEIMMARENAVVQVDESADGLGLVFAVPGEGKFEVRLNGLSQAIRDRATLHGLKQRISDKAAIPRDTTTGQSATPKQKFDAMKALADHYMTGTDQWDLRGPGKAQGGGDEVELILRAVAAIQGLTVEDLRERVKVRCEKTGDKVATWAKRLAGAPGAQGDSIRAKMAELRVRADSQVDVDAELASLMG